MAAGVTDPGRTGGSDLASRAESHALDLIEFPRVLDRIASLASSEPGRHAVLSLTPARQVEAVREALATVDEMIGLHLRFEDFALPRIPSAGATLRRLMVEGSVLSVEQLAEVLALLTASRMGRADLRRLPDELPRLAALGARMVRLERTEDRLVRSLDPGGGLADAASKALARIRRSLRDSRAALVGRLERFARRLPERYQVPDASVTVRSGRYCIPIRREGMSAVGGIVHDESATHQTLFVEPPVAIEPMNHIAELEREEDREIRRILEELTDHVRPDAPALLDSLAALAEADSLCARARYALQHGGSTPSVLAEGTGRSDYRVTEARHPLLEGRGEPVVPFGLALQSDERALLISGPNAGGKTVLLKAVGLLSAMSQAGIVPPVGEGSRFPLFRHCFAIIGDEQSIQASLSTFSAQAESLRIILENADADSLVLIDELGGSTDPAEGSALAAAVLVRLARQAGLTLATTHLGELKELAAEHPSIVNASLQFDTEALRPTFRLVRDRPGRSYALEIARRLGLPDDVLDDARSRLSGAERRTESLLKQLEERESELDSLVAETRLAAGRSQRAARTAEEREQRLARREREAEREARKRAESYLLEARREVESEIERLRSRVEEALSTAGEVARELEEGAQEARSAVEARLRDTRTHLQAREPSGASGRLSPGMRVRSRSLGVEGRLLEVGSMQAVVEAGGIRISVSPGDLEEMSPADAQPSRRTPDAPLPDIDPRTEVDLRGLRVDEIGSTLVLALDAAVVNDVPMLRIVHGKGTGALREEVRRVLADDPRVASYRSGGFQEGGSGVTVVEFTKA